MKKFFLVSGLLILFAAEILRVYFIMPFPGSQHANTIDIAYFIDQNIWYIRLIAVLLIAIPLFNVFARKRLWSKIAVSVILILYAVVFYFFNFKFLAEKMFYQPQHKGVVSVDENKVPLNKLVIGVALNGEAKAYPIQIIGYHHQVQDTIAGEPIIVTYCTVCRTGRIYSPMVNGRKESFRLVGMDHFNAKKSILSKQHLRFGCGLIQTQKFCKLILCLKKSMKILQNLIKAHLKAVLKKEIRVRGK
jgi:hypothetical protein